MEEALAYLRSLDRIIIPSNYTYLNHCTCYCPTEVRQKINNRFLRYWESIPTESFVTSGDMSFVERKHIITGEIIDYKKNLKDISVFYTYRDYAKPFMIRVILPKLVDPKTQTELRKVYYGGDGRHPKIPNKTKLYAFASTTVDELSQKKIDIIYFVREEDLITYASEVRRAIETRELEEFSFEELDSQVRQIEYDDTILSRSGALTYFNKGLIIPRDKDFSRYSSNGDKSPFEEEYYSEYQDYINMLMEDGKLPNIPFPVRMEITSYYEKRYVDSKDKQKQ